MHCRHLNYTGVISQVKWTYNNLTTHTCKTNVFWDKERS